MAIVFTSLYFGFYYFFSLLVNCFCFEWRFSALPCVANAERGLIHSFLALCAFSTLSTLSTGFQHKVAQ
jgi:hypothetical protein